MFRVPRTKAWVGSQFKGTDGRPSVIPSMNGGNYDYMGGGVTSPVSAAGNYLVGIKMSTNAETPYVNSTSGEVTYSPATDGELSAHEIIGHALAGLTGAPFNGLQAIRVSNMYLRNEKAGKYRLGDRQHGGEDVSEEEANAIPGYLVK